MKTTKANLMSIRAQIFSVYKEMRSLGMTRKGALLYVKNGFGAVPLTKTK